MTRPWRIGIDVGGTFTDGIVWNDEGGEVATAKVLSTPRDPGLAMLEAVDRLVGNGGAPSGAISYLVHGTTVATNAVLQRKLARTAFVTTRGFRDLLEIARQVRADAYDVFAEKPPALVPRRLCFEVDERLGADGEPLVPLDPASLEDLVAQLRSADVQAVAVCLLHAYRNPAHERMVAETIRRELPDLAVSISSDLASEFREFQRACTTIINSGLMPEVSGYLGRLDRVLAERGVSGSRLVMQSNGGVSDFLHSAMRPVFLIESGPAAGVVGAAHFAQALGEPDVISFDMGGTTAKVGLVQGNAPQRVQEFEIGLDANRSRSWNAGAAGYPILTPAVDLVEIGTGGGSLAWVDDGGKLRVGPTSAGADPGPACYGRGGNSPSITDADLVLGRLNPDYFLGGEMKLDVAAAERALDEIAGGMDMTRIEAAAGILQIADAAMSQALRLVSVQRGYDPGRFKLVAFGGAGPLHAVSIAAETGIRSVLVPPRPGIASALGLLVADLKHDYAVTRIERLADCEPTALERAFKALEQEGRAAFVGESVPEERMRFERAIDLRYVGQSYHLTIPVAAGPATREMLEDARERFNNAHLASYGYAEAGEPCELVNLRVSAVGLIRTPTLAAEPEGQNEEDARTGVRPVWFPETGFVDCPVLDRLRLRAGKAFAGPAVIEDPDATTLVHPGWCCAVGPHGVLVIERQG